MTLTGGTGAGQLGYITNYTGSSLTAQVDTDWAIQPDSTTTYTVSQNAYTFVLSFSSTKRLPTDSPGTGLTNLSLMRPTTPGGSAWYPTTAIFNNLHLSYLNSFTALRFMTHVNGSPVTTWGPGTIVPGTGTSSRPQPDYYSQIGPYASSQLTGGPCYEHQIMWCNRLGKDLYVNVPDQAVPVGLSPADTTSFVYQLASLIANGATINGVSYPPLLPHLKVYIEYSNELWNGLEPQYTRNSNAATASVQASDADGQILNFDGAGTGGGFALGLAYRRVGLKSVQVSNVFRAVFGDTAMGSRVRPLIMWQQSAGTGGEALNILEFIDGYFNASWGSSPVSSPNPVQYYFWGGGAASYWNSSTDTASTEAGVLAGQIPTSDQSSPTGGFPTDVNWAGRYGLANAAYEGGLGSEGNGGVSLPVINGLKWVNPAMRLTANVAFNQLAQGGLAFNVGGTWIWQRDYVSADTAINPTLLAVSDTLGTLPPLPTNGTLLPSPNIAVSTTNPGPGYGFGTAWTAYNVILRSTAP